MKMTFKHFFSGLGKLLTIYPEDSTRKINFPIKSDEEAIYSDWLAVGNDIKISCTNYGKMTNEQKKSNYKNRTK